MSTVKEYGYTMAEAGSGFARLGALLRGEDPFGELVRRAADVDCFYEQARIVGLTRDQAAKILREERAVQGRTFNEIMTYACRRLSGPPADGTDPAFERAVEAVVRVSGAPASVVREALMQVGLHCKYGKEKDK